MLKFLGRIFGRKDTQECQSDLNHEILATSYVNRNNATPNQDHSYSDFHQTYDLSWGTHCQSRDQMFNCSGSSNVSLNFTDRSSTSSVLNKQEEAVVVSSSSSTIKSEKIIVDSDIKPNTRVGTFEKQIIDFEMKSDTGLRTFEKEKTDQNLDSMSELHFSLNSSSVSSKLPLHPSIPPPFPVPCALLPPSLFDIPAASLHHHPVANESTSVLVSSNLTTLETTINRVEIEKGVSYLHEVTDDIQYMIEGDKLNSSVHSSLSGKCPPNSSKATITCDSSNRKTLQKEALNISVKKEESFSNDVADDCKDTDTRGIVPLVLEKHSSSPTPKLDSSSPLPSLGRHLTSPKCSSFSEKHTVSVPSKSATQQTKNKSMWVQKGASSRCAVSEDSTNLTSIDMAQGDLQKPFAETFRKSDLSLSSFGNFHLHEADDIQNFSKAEKKYSSVSSSLSGKTLDSPKCSPNFNKATITSDSSKKKTLQIKVLNISVKKDDSFYDPADDFKDAKTRSIAPLVFMEHSSSVTPTLDSSSLLPSVKRHLSSQRCSSLYKKPTVSVSFNSSTQQTKNKSIWVQKGASSRCVGSEDFTNLTSIDIMQGDLEKPISEAFHKSDLSLSSYGTNLHPPKHPPISDNTTSSFSSSKPTNQQTKAMCVQVKKGASSRSLASEGSENLIKINIVPGLIEKPSSPLSPVLYPSSYETPPSSPKFPPIFKPTLSSDSSSSTTQQNKSKYIWVEKGAFPLYVVPEDFKDLVKRDLVPEVLKKPLSPLTYKDYFAALLYAEDYYIEKWDGFEMEDVSMEVKLKNVSLELHRAEIHRRNGESKKLYRSDNKDNRTFVQFELESIPETRPFLLSKDFAYVRPSGTEDTPFKGIIYRVVKSKHLLVEFGKDFYEQHYSECKYDVQFSLNRVCLKRAHKAVEAASDVVFKNFLFPNSIPRSNHVFLEEIHPFHLTRKWEQECAIQRIVMHQSPSPYLVEGPLSVSGLISEKILTTTGKVIQDAVLQLLRTSSLNRILICAPSNSACDALVRNLQKEIPISDMFRSNAAFRELDEVPDDIIPFCPYEEEQELFPCPPLAELENFRLILSTFMSTFRLHHEGLKAGHFSHIFLVDASSATEPETLVPLSNLANEKTFVVVTGKPRDFSRWVRSKIARDNGLRTSYFERLRNSELYMTLDPQVISQLSMT